jgi:hypothetical protein
LTSGIFERCSPSFSQGETSSLVEDALDVIRAVFDAIPTFWGSAELGCVFRLYLDALALGHADEIGPCVRRVASRAPTAALLSTYFEIWPSISDATAEASLYSSLMN